MQGEIFLTFVRRLIFVFFLVVLGATASRAQNAGNVGIYTKQISVFSAQNTSASSSILPDFGFASQSLFIVTTVFSGTIDLEWSPTYSASTNPNATFYPLTTATYTSDASIHILQLGGYWPNLRSTVTVSGGSISAWYTASASPIPYTPPAIGSTGPTSPFQCDQFAPATVIGNGTNVQVVFSNTRGFAVCGFTISFTGATSAATSGVQVGYGAACATGGGVFPWFIATTASTPQIINVGGGLGALFQIPAIASDGICVGNHSGSGLEISVWYALI